jgi:hypothetical protein
MENEQQILSRIQYKKEIGDDHFFFKVDRKCAKDIVRFFKNKGYNARINSGTLNYACILVTWEPKKR